MTEDRQVEEERDPRVSACLAYIAVLEDCFGTLLAANTLTPGQRAEYDDLMAKVRDAMARAPAALDAMLQLGIRPHRQPHLDTLAGLPGALAPGSDKVN